MKKTDRLKKMKTDHLGNLPLPKILVFFTFLTFASLHLTIKSYTQTIENEIIKENAIYNTLYFKHFSTTDGLSDNSVNCVLEDGDGFIWVGTSQGLNRFDGYDWIHFFKDGAMNAVCGNDIRVLTPSQDGGFWVGTADGGLCKYCIRDRNFIHYNFKGLENPESKEIMDISAHPKWGTFVSIYGHGIYKLNCFNQSFEPNHLVDNNIQNRFYSLLTSDMGLYSAPLGFGLLANFGDILECFSLFDGFNTPYPGHTLSYLYAGEKNEIWAGAWDNGLYRFCEVTKDFSLTATLDHQSLSHNKDEITTIASTGNILWLGTKRSGLFHYHIESKSFSNYQHEFLDKNSISSNSISHIYKDSNGNIWVSTDQGLNLFHPDFNKFTTYYLSGDIRSAEFSQAVQSIGSGMEMVFVATRDKVFRCSPKHWDCSTLAFSPGSGEFIYSILLSTSGKLVIGTNKTAYHSSFPYHNWQPFTAVYNKVDHDSQHKSNFDFFDIFSSRITAIRELRIADENALVFYAYGHGFSIINSQTGAGFFSYPRLENYEVGLFNDVYVDSKNRLWLLNGKTGIWGDFQLLDTNTAFVHKAFRNIAECVGTCFLTFGQSPLLNFQSAYELAHGTTNVIKMAEVAEGEFYAIVAGKGLSIFRPDSKNAFEIIPSPNQNFRDLIVDHLERVWLSGPNGLSIYDPVDQSWHQIDKSNGLPEKGLAGQLYLLDDGTVLAGSFGSVVHFNPEEFDFVEEPPRVALTHFQIFGKNADHLLSGNPSIRLTYAENFFTFNFTSFNYHSSANRSYFYKLEGFHNEWVNAGRNRSATFTNLRGGDYIFKIKTVDATGQESEIQTVHLSIIPPFYLRDWFFLLTGFSIIAIGWLFYVLRINNINKLQKMRLSTEIEAKEQERQRLARDLHDELGTRLSALKLYLGSIEKYLLPKPEAEEIKRQAGELLDDSVRDLRNMLLNLSPQTVQRYGYFSALEDLAAKINATGQIKVLLNRNGSKERLAGSTELGVYRIVQELINNSLKHSGCNTIDINVIQKPNRLTIFFEDDGKGMDMLVSKSGFGLKNIENRLSLIKGSVEWDSSPGEGLRAIITINFEEA